MSHVNFAYSQSSPRALVLNSSPWLVREDEGGYSLTRLVDLTDTVIDSLLKAEALSWVLHGSKDYPENAVAETTSVIAHLVHTALEAHREQWEQIQQHASQNK